jgi:nitric oxide dioxygenase
VHDNLMWAIADVLGDAMTRRSRRRGTVYWLLAYTLIHVERGLYSARGVRPQTVWREWEVEQKIQETGDAVTFVVKRVDDRLAKPSLPGQYVTVQMPLPDGTRQPRQYSRAGPTTVSTGSSRSSGCTAREGRTDRSRRCCTARSTWATC